MLCFLALSALAAETFILPAQGTHAVVYESSDWGRFAFEVASPRGTALHLVDRMTGPGTQSGRSGSEDGRIDTFLDRGEVKAVLESPADGDGDATLTVTRFERLGEAPVLPWAQQVTTTLDDRTERAFWLEVTDTREAPFEAVGRYLGDLRLWRDGSWLVDATPECGSVEPRAGQPLQRCVLETSLEPGLYQLVAYGGPGESWSEAGSSSELYVRWDIPRLASAGRERRTIGPTGTDRFRVPDTDFAQLELAPGEVGTVGLQAYHSGRVFSQGGSTAAVTPSLRVPTAAVRDSSGSSKVMRVSGPPGQAYTLTWFDETDSVVLDDHDYWVSTLHAADLDDTATPTVELYRVVPSEPAEPLLDTAIELSPKKAYRERFNLLGTTRLLVNVEQTGRYRIAATGTDAQLRIEPRLATLPDGYEPPGHLPGEFDDTLDAGGYIVTLEPSSATGIVELQMMPNGWTSWASSTIGAGPAESVTRPELQGRFSSASLTLSRAQSESTERALTARRLPVDPSRSVLISLLPGETVALPVEVQTSGRLWAETEDGVALPVEIAGLRAEEHALAAGRQDVSVHNDGSVPVRGSLRFTPEASPLAPPSEDLLAELPVFPRLSAENPAGIDLEKGERETWTLDVTEPGLYRLQSTGLLRTDGAVRTRTRTRLAGGSANGVGRNFLVARYLREGDYQLTVTALGQSAGHAGLVLDRTTMRKGGALSDGLPSRLSLPAGDAAEYHFTVEERGEYRIRSFGPGRTFQCRLQDADGWPITAPSQACDLTQELAPGNYSVVTLPEAIATRRITQIDRARDVRVYDGHGPHSLPLDEPVTHVWSEPAEGAERTPDQWSFDLPAPTRVTIRAGEEMAGRLLNAQGELARVVPGRPLEAELDAGAYTLELRSGRRSTGVGYTVQVTPQALVTGMSRTVRAPSVLEISVGRPGPVSLYSTGDVDVRATLEATTGEVIASSDDRPDDWNFRTAAWLVPGRYRLRVESVGSRSARTMVHMEQPEAEPGPPLTPGKARRLVPGVTGRLLPVELQGEPDLLRIVARSRETVSVAVEIDSGTHWQTLGTATGRPADLALRLPPGVKARARVWSLDGGQNPVDIDLRTPTLRATRESALASGVSADRGIRLASGQPGLLQLSRTHGLRACLERGQPCTDASAVVPIGDDGLILIGQKVKAWRASLQQPTPLTVADHPVEIDLPEGEATLLIARTSTHPPGLSIGGTQALGDRASLVAALDGQRRARVWRPHPGPGGLDVRLVAQTLSRREGPPALGGRQSWLVPAQTALDIPLPDSMSKLDLTLEAGLAAETGEQLVWADGEAREVRMEGATRLVLLNPTDTERRVAVSLLEGGTENVVGLHASLERWMATTGSALVPVEATNGTLKVRGATATYVRSDGQILPADGAKVGGGGLLDLRWAPGPVLAWVEGEHPGPLRDTSGAPRKPILGPWQGAVSGSATTLDVDVGAPKVIHLTVGCPFIATIDGAGPRRVVVRERGGSLDAWAPDGSLSITVRALEGTTLFGEALLTTSELVTLTEGLGPEVLLAPGASRWFRFEVDREGPVGFGVRADADRVIAKVVDPDGSVISEGVIQRVSLTPGEWLLALSQPADATPVSARPAIAGLDAPDTGPPDNVIREYLDLAGLNGGDQ